MKEYTVAILGATGAVGQEMRKRLEERNFCLLYTSDAADE